MYPYLDIFGMSIPSYGLCMAVGILLSFYICFVRARKNKLDIDSLIVIAACAVGLGLVGAICFCLALALVSHTSRVMRYQRGF